MAGEVIEIPTRLEYLRRRIQPALEEPIRTHILVGAGALCVGLGVGYLLGKRNRYVATVEVETVSDIHKDPNQMKFEFDSDELAEELAETQRILDDIRAKRLAKLDEDNLGVAFVVEEDEEREADIDLVIKDESVEDFVAEKLKAAMTTSNGSLDPEDEPITQSVFSEYDGWNLEEEMRRRSDTQPYILHKDEFWADEKNYTQTTLTYYDGDNILADEEEAPIYNHERVTGPLKFGHGSGDKNVVYIRNDKLRAEYEILYDSGLFSVEVLGLDIPDNARVRDRPRDRDLRHSNYRKFRDTE